jgi:hypothetical protein
MVLVGNIEMIHYGQLVHLNGTTGSYTINEGGGTWYTASVNNTSYSQTFSKYVDDLNVEVTEYVKDWMSGSRDNNGFIIKDPIRKKVVQIWFI